MKSQRRIVIALGLTLFFLGIGTFGYVEIEDYSILEAFYMTVITISTVGFGEINPLSEGGRVFTIFLILSGVGSLAFAAHAFTESMIERAANPKIRQRAMQRKIRNLNGHYIICGHGRVGASAADYFHKIGKEFVVLEKSKEHLEFLEQQGYHYVEGDATHEDTLLEAGIKSAGGLLALLDSDPENLFTVLTAREMNPTLHIIARTEVASSESRILRAGADSVISPYASAGRRVAGRIIKDTEQESRERRTPEAKGESQLKWITVTDETGLASHAILSANTLVKGTIMGIRRDGKDILQPSPDFQLAMGDELLVAFLRARLPGTKKPEQPKKIVLVDDNPVIRRLYTRLFQKAGFNILTAENGTEGYEMILAEEPDAAVIDYHLPDITGLEICRQIREDENGIKIMLFLFTADELDSTKQKALATGVDTVVVKSPDAGEIVSIVKEGLGQ